MPSPLPEVAKDHASFRRRLAVAVADEAQTMWSAVDPARIQRSWLSSIARLLVLLVGAQRVVAAQADQYLDDVLTAQRIDPTSQGQVAREALSGVASDGRPLDTLLYQPVVATLTGIQRDGDVQRSLAGGLAVLDMIVRTQVADAGRGADLVAMTARRQATGYVRMLVGASCSRCVILAGRRYRWNAGFQRHPRCDCVHVPAREDSADDIRTDPKAFFGSLNAAEQDRVFTKAGAEAIRSGADIAQVVNARRGMQTATIGGEKVLITTEGTRRSARRVRLMPEAILKVANGDRAEAIRLLKLHRYLLP